MQRGEWQAAIVKGRLQQKRDWLGDLLGLWIVTGIWATIPFSAFLSSNTLFHKAAWLCIALSLPGYAIYCLIGEKNLTPIATNLSATENRKLVVFAFKALNWRINTNNKLAVIGGANNKWWRGAGQTATVLIADGKVLLNIIHGGTSTGRLPFYFGSNRRKLKRLIATIESAKTLLVHKQ